MELIIMICKSFIFTCDTVIAIEGIYHLLRDIHTVEMIVFAILIEQFVIPDGWRLESQIELMVRLAIDQLFVSL